MRFVLAAAIVGALLMVADLVSDTSLAAIRSGRNESTNEDRSDLFRRLTMDLVYGVVIAGLFVMLADRLPGDTGIAKGIALGVVVWFVRVLRATSAWVANETPRRTLSIGLALGLAEMLLIGVVLGLLLGASN